MPGEVTCDPRIAHGVESRGCGSDNRFKGTSPVDSDPPTPGATSEGPARASGLGRGLPAQLRGHAREGHDGLGETVWLLAWVMRSFQSFSRE